MKTLSHKGSQIIVTMQYKLSDTWRLSGFVAKKDFSQRTQYRSVEREALEQLNIAPLTLNLELLNL